MSSDPLKVLLIEDNPGDARLIQEMFFDIKAPPLDLKSVESLAEGKISLSQESFDLVLLDLGLPDSQGLDSLLVLHSVIPKVPIVVLTALSDDLIAKKAVGKGAQDFLIKGQVDSNLLARSIFYAIERSKIMQTLKYEQKALEKSEKEYRKAYNYTEFYKDLLSHDMANILQSILLSTELSFSFLNNNEMLQEQLGIIQGQVDRAAKLISTIQKLSTLEESKPIIEPIEINSFLKKAIKAIQASFEHRDIQIKINSPDKELNAQANSLITEVFENILQNAVKFNKNAVVDILIKISEAQREGIYYLQFDFIDNGVGIPDELKEKIFQREDIEEKREKGTGLGLSLVSKVLASYNGKIWVEDKIPGDYSKGSNFIIQIPEAL